MKNVQQIVLARSGLHFFRGKFEIVLSVYWLSATEVKKRKYSCLVVHGRNAYL